MRSVEIHQRFEQLQELALEYDTVTSNIRPNVPCELLFFLSKGGFFDEIIPAMQRGTNAQYWIAGRTDGLFTQELEVVSRSRHKQLEFNQKEHDCSMELVLDVVQSDITSNAPPDRTSVQLSISDKQNRKSDQIIVNVHHLSMSRPGIHEEPKVFVAIDE